MVLLHGLCATWRAWLPVLPMLESSHRVFAPTLPGHYGGMSWPEGSDPSIGGIVDILSEQFANRGIERPHVVGNSLGGWLALELARRGLVSSVTCFSPAGGWRSADDFRSVANSFRQVRKIAPFLVPFLSPCLGFAGFRRLLNRQVMERGDRVSKDEVLEAIKAFCSTSILLPLLASMEREGPIKPMGDVKVPVSVAWGSADKTIPFEKYGVRLLAAVPGAKHLTLDFCGHVPMYDDPKAVVSVILSTSKVAPT
jgi:pimeloyl-ACP methyl ester carboxylesterase